MFVYNDLSIAKNYSVFNTGRVRITKKKPNAVSDDWTKEYAERRIALILVLR